ncbi:MAG: hypothetical protein ACK53U_07240 [Alphaproteobacteria bacterium]|jgi:hypothetical protein
MNEKTFKADISFEAGVYIERDAIDQQTGALDLRKIYLHATPRSLSVNGRRPFFHVDPSKVSAACPPLFILLLCRA